MEWTIDETPFHGDNGVVGESMTAAPKGRKTASHVRSKAILLFIKEWSSVLAIPLSVFAIWQPIHKQSSDEHLQVVFQQQMRENHLDTLAGDVAELKGELKTLDKRQSLSARPAVENAASLKQADFDQALPALAGALHDARSLKINFPSSIVQKLSQLVAASPTDAPGYWKVAGAVIDARARSVSPEIPLPNCLSEFRHYTELQPHLPGEPYVHEQNFGNCRLALDDVKAYMASPFGQEVQLDKGSGGVIVRLHLRNALVTYAGHPLIPFASIECVNCSFQIDAPESPSVVGQNLVKQLLAQNTETVQIDRPKG